MSFEFGQATVFEDIARIRMLGSAMRKTGRPVVLVRLGEGIHAGHISLIRAATLLPRAVVVVAWSGEDIPEDFERERVDVVWRVRDQDLWPRGRRTLIDASLERPLEPVAEELTRMVALCGVLKPSDLVVGEKDFELACALRRVNAELHLGVDIHGVPTVRTAEGVAMSLRNVRVAADARDDVLTLSAALTAGAYAAEKGAEEVLAVTRAVLQSAGVEPEYLELRGLDFGPPPEIGDARLLVAAEIGGVRLTDNVGVPVGIGFKNLGEQDSPGQ